MLSTLATRRATIAGLFGVFAVLGVARIPVQVPSRDELQYPASDLRPMGPLTRDSWGRQTFAPTDERISGIAAHLATYARANAGITMLFLERRRATTWKVLAESSVPTRAIQDNQFHLFTFDRPVTVSKGDELAIRIETDSDASNGIAWWFNAGFHLPDSHLYERDLEVDGTARFKVINPPKRGKLLGPRMRTLVWDRVTVLLGPFGQTLLLLGSTFMLVGTVYLLSKRPEDPTK